MNHESHFRSGQKRTLITQINTDMLSPGRKVGKASGIEKTNTNCTNCTNAGWAKTNTESMELTETQRKNLCKFVLFVFEKMSTLHLLFVVRKNFCVFCAFCVRYCSPRLTQNVTRSTYTPVPTFPPRKQYSCKFVLFVFEKMSTIASAYLCYPWFYKCVRCCVLCFALCGESQNSCKFRYSCSKIMSTVASAYLCYPWFHKFA
jgi:hypothetical protein